MAYLPPRAFRRKDDADDKGQWPNPLKRIRLCTMSAQHRKVRWAYTHNSISPFVRSPSITDDGADTNQLTKAPAGVDVRRQIATKSHGADLRSVGDGEGLEHTPRNTTQNLSYLKMDDVLRREEDGCESRQ